MMMGSRNNHPNWQRIAIIMMIIYSLTLLPHKSGGLMFLIKGEGLKEMNKVLGSRPPGCVGKCFSCRPCIATLAIPPHHKSNIRAATHGDETYYLLSWKCKCGDKFFQP